MLTKSHSSHSISDSRRHKDSGLGESIGSSVSVTVMTIGEARRLYVEMYLDIEITKNDGYSLLVMVEHKPNE
jgi:hypothetical protein